MRHRIIDIDLHSPLPEQYIACSCGSVVLADGMLALGYAWDKHRDVPVAVVSYADPATDAEVSEFLRQVEDPGYRASPRVGAAVQTSAPDTETVAYLMERLLLEHEPRDPECPACLSLSRAERRAS